MGALALSKASGGHSTNLAKFKRNAAFTWYSTDGAVCSRAGAHGEKTSRTASIALGRADQTRCDCLRRIDRTNRSVIPRLNALLSPLVSPRQLGVNAALDQTRRGRYIDVFIFEVAILQKVLAY